MVKVRVNPYPNPNPNQPQASHSNQSEARIPALSYEKKTLRGPRGHMVIVFKLHVIKDVL